MSFWNSLKNVVSTVGQKADATSLLLADLENLRNAIRGMKKITPETVGDLIARVDRIQEEITGLAR